MLTNSRASRRFRSRGLAIPLSKSSLIFSNSIPDIKSPFKEDTISALDRSEKLQKKAASVGFDWDKINDVEDKLTEEFQELKNAENDFEKELEIGDVFFSMVNLARWHNVDPETSLRKANRRFNERLIEVERLCDERQIEIKSLSNELRDNLWIEAKNNIK